ncbi:MAG: HD-GYP domain-containing protein [Eubacterium sp.]|nr:HD-GYP domain-containing protein [Eubacterium sp.]
MRKEKKSYGAQLFFIITLLISLAVLAIAIIKTNVYNAAEHRETFQGDALFSAEDSGEGKVSVKAIPRSSTWSKVFDIKEEGINKVEHQAYTYDFTVSNNTTDQLKDFTFKLTFNKQAFLLSAWNGALEFHQNIDGKDVVNKVPDLRDYNTADYNLKYVTVDGEALVMMNPGDYLVYYPAADANAMEIPIEAKEATTPGVILYVPLEKDISDSVLELDYSLHRQYTSEPLFWISVVAGALWFVALIAYTITSIQIRKYKIQHEHDNKVINESIETFTGFIDAKDPYTNGHSKRVALYTRCIAEEFGYTGEELDRVYYIALLHDCGKIGVPDHILGKPGRLTDEEFEVIKSHTVRGGEILRSFKSIEKAYEGALYHHERYDGNGYPEKIAGEDIPFVARMICVADSFDAMNSNRVYRKKLTKEDIIEEIERNKGTQFDPKVADAFLKLYKEDKLPKEDEE